MTFLQCFIKRMLHLGLKVKKLNNVSNFKSVVNELCEISCKVIERLRDASKLRFSIETEVDRKTINQSQNI